MGNPLFATKPIETLMKEASDSGEHSLRRALGPINLVTLGIGAIIGAGIFVITGQAAAQFAGPAIIISFVLAGIACAFAGLCYAEFASMIPIAGSAYTYSYATLGELIAWIIGWDLILEYAFGAATVAVGWSGHLRAFMRDLGWNLPAMPTSSFTLFGMPMQLKYDYVGFLVILAITAILVIGIKESANFTTAIVILKVAVVCMFIALATMFLASHGWKPNFWHPFIPANTGTRGEFGWSGILRGAGVVFFAYIGFDAVSTAAQEAKNPKKDMPFGILGSLVICTVLYILVSGLLTHLVPYTQLNVPDPVVVGIYARECGSVGHAKDASGAEASFQNSDGSAGSHSGDRVLGPANRVPLVLDATSFVGLVGHRVDHLFHLQREAQQSPQWREIKSRRRTRERLPTAHLRIGTSSGKVFLPNSNP